MITHLARVSADGQENGVDHGDSHEDDDDDEGGLDTTASLQDGVRDKGPKGWSGAAHR